MDIQPGSMSSNPDGLMTDGYRLFFSAFDGLHGRELWVAEPLFGTVRRVADINPALTEGSNPAHMTQLNGMILFQASSYGNDLELWRTDGSAKNTVLVKDILPGIVSGSRPQNFTIFNRKAYFQAFNGASTNLWRTDGTTKGTSQVGSVGVEFDRGVAVEFRGELYFTGRSPWEGLELWKLDVQSGDPRLVHDVFPGPRGSEVDHLIVYRNELYFVAEGLYRLPYELTGVELWKTDGTNLKLIELREGALGSNPTMLRVLTVGTEQALYFVAKGTVPGRSELTGDELWSINAGRVTLFDLVVGEIGSSPRGLMVGPRGYLYFSAWNKKHGSELWRSDGTRSGTKLFKAMQFYGAPWGSRPSYMTNHRTVGMIFACDDGPHSSELWQCDGTVAGTTLLAEINPVPKTTRGSSPVLKTTVGGSVYFTARTANQAPVMWMSDGTAAGTFEVPALRSAKIRNVLEVKTIGNTVYLVGAGVNANGKPVGFELWAVDHTNSKATLLDIRAGVYGSLPRNLTEFRGELFFSAIGDLNHPGAPAGRELWRTDGTVAGTRMVADISSGVVNSIALSSDPNQMFQFRNRLYFAARDENHGLELWVTDGSRNGTKLLLDINTGVDDSHPHGFKRLGDRFVFVATGSKTGTELYVSDATAAGTTRIDIRKGPGSGFPKWHTHADKVFGSAGGYVYFAADGDLNQTNGSTGLELWRSDGTAKGTTNILDIWTGGLGSDPEGIVRLGDTDKVVFIATTGAGTTRGGPSMWVSDGTKNGTRLLRYFNARWLGLNSTKTGKIGARRAYFQIPLSSPNASELGFEIFFTDGTTTGTRLVISDAYPVGRLGVPPDTIVSPTGQLFMSRIHPDFGAELWVVEGLATATKIGRGCSFRLDPPTLSSNDPVMGGVVRPIVKSVPNSLGLLAVGMWQATPYSFGGDCRFHVDYFGPFVILPFATNGSGIWQGALSTKGAFDGFRYAIQACVNDIPRAPSVGFTNGIVLTAGRR
jgi:ELWxxDGT repeat protein